MEWGFQKELFEILLPEEDYEKYRSSWSNWLRGPVQRINNGHIRTSIQRQFDFDGSIWDAPDRTQREVLRQAVKRFVHPDPQIDLNELLPRNVPLSDEQMGLLVRLRNACEDDSLELLERADHFLEPRPENQNFLLELLPLLYRKGMYDFLESSVFPSLLPHNAESSHIKIFRAHTLGSLKNPDYLRAASLLLSIETDAPEELMELQTGVISNVRRYHLEKPDLTREELAQTLPVMTRYYTEVFETAQKHHYYPGINLAYMLTLSRHCVPETHHIDPDEVANIYRDAEPSIVRDGTDGSEELRYYARMSDMEFRLLLGRDHLQHDLYVLLEEGNPSYISYVERTLRMMEFFIRTMKRFGDDRGQKLAKNFTEFAELLKGYLDHASS
jgi:hypothetical protein